MALLEHIKPVEPRKVLWRDKHTVTANGLKLSTCQFLEREAKMRNMSVSGFLREVIEELEKAGRV